MADTATFLAALSSQIKRHPELYPAWVPVLLEDIREASENVNKREAQARRSEYEQARAAFGVQSI